MHGQLSPGLVCNKFLDLPVKLYQTNLAYSTKQHYTMLFSKWINSDYASNFRQNQVVRVPKFTYQCALLPYKGKDFLCCKLFLSVLGKTHIEVFRQKRRRLEECFFLIIIVKKMLVLSSFTKKYITPTLLIPKGTLHWHTPEVPLTCSKGSATGDLLWLIWSFCVDFVR